MTKNDQFLPDPSSWKCLNTPQNSPLDLDGKGGDLRAIRITQSKKRKRVNDEPEQITLSSDDEDEEVGIRFIKSNFIELSL